MNALVLKAFGQYDLNWVFVKWVLLENFVAVGLLYAARELLGIC